MPKKRFSAEQIVTLLRQIEVSMAQGKSAPEACREAGISQQGSLKSLSLPTTFQAEDEGSIPFTRSNLFNDLGGGTLGFVSRRAAVLCHGGAMSDGNLCREEPSTSARTGY